MSRDHCNLIKEMAYPLQSGAFHLYHEMKLLYVSAVANFIQLFTILAQSNICEGNSDQRYLELPPIKNDCIKDTASKCSCNL